MTKAEFEKEMASLDRRGRFASSIGDLEDLESIARQRKALVAKYKRAARKARRQAVRP